MDASRGSRTRLGVGAAIVLVVVALALTVVIGIVRSAGSPIDEVGGPATVDASGGVPTTPAAAGVYVHVHGAVAHPGLYRLETGARVVDVIAAAGGFDEDAEPSAVNLARTISDGEQLYVPEVGEVPPVTGATGPSGAAGSGDGLVNLNTADETALDTLPRIGPALAGRIIAWREQNGRFTSVDDLLAVPGIGEKMLAGLRDLVTV